MMLTSDFTIRSILLLFSILGISMTAPSSKRQIQSGIVPIFGNRVTMEPITFTFTTAGRKLGRQFPTLRPDFIPPVQINKPHFSKEFKYEVQMPTSSSQNIQNFMTTPVYNHAIQYKAMQASLQQDAYSTYRTIWKQIGDTWKKMKAEVHSEGVDEDWKQFWNKLSTTVEPYMGSITVQFGKLVDTFVKYYQNKFPTTFDS